jgi:hypothetical protein
MEEAKSPSPLSPLAYAMLRSAHTFERQSRFGSLFFFFSFSIAIVDMPRIPPFIALFFSHRLTS